MCLLPAPVPRACLDFDYIVSSSLLTPDASQMLTKIDRSRAAAANVSAKTADDDDTADEGALSPPPSTSSSVSSVNIDVLGEIVVGE
jgi:hypothetical protein